MRLICLLLAIAVMLGACNKSPAVKAASYPEALGGKWRYVEYFYSTGEPGKWYAVNPVKEWIDLKQNGEISSNLSPFKDASSYQVIDSVTIKFTVPSAQNGFLLYRYNIDTVQGGLIFSPLTPLCIEGCAIRFRR